VVAQKPDEIEILKEEIDKELTHALSKIKLVDRGVFVQASTLGALEALGDFLKSSKIPVSIFLKSLINLFILVINRMEYYLVY
jgi:translation initiation factor 5B